MRKPRPESTSTHVAESPRSVLARIPQPGRRRLALEAENRKVRAQVSPRVSWFN